MAAAWGTLRSRSEVKLLLACSSRVRKTWGVEFTSRKKWEYIEYALPGSINRSICTRPVWFSSSHWLQLRNELINQSNSDTHSNFNSNFEVNSKGYMIGKEWNLTLGDSHFFYTPQGGPLRSCGSACKKDKNELVRMWGDGSPRLQSTRTWKKECTFWVRFRVHFEVGVSVNSKTELDHEQDEYKSRAYFPYRKRDVIDTWSVERNSPFRIAVITMHASKVCTFANGPRLQHCVNMLWNDSCTTTFMLH